MELSGKTTVTADAEGILVIEGDTVPDVLRVHTQRRFVQDPDFRCIPCGR